MLLVASGGAVVYVPATALAHRTYVFIYAPVSRSVVKKLPRVAFGGALEEAGLSMESIENIYRVIHAIRQWVDLI